MVVVICQICNKEFKRVTNTHLKKHDLTQQDYFKLFPGILWEEQSKQHSEFMKRKWQDPIYSQEMKQLHLGSKRSEETKEKMSRGKMGELNPNYGKVCTPKEIAFRRKIASDWERTLGYREKLSRAGQGRIVTQEQRQNLSIKQKHNWQNGVYDGVFQSPTKPERAVMQALTNLGVEYEFNSFRLGSRLYDFYLPTQNILIEYDGYYWHSQLSAIANDALKDEFAQNVGIPLIRLKGTVNHDLAYDEIYNELSAAL